MKIIKNNIFDFGAAPFKGDQKEAFEDILRGEGRFKVERIYSKAYTCGEWYEQEQDEFVLLLSGSASLDFETSKVHMAAGDWIVIEKGVRHRVASTSMEPACVWLAVFGHFKKTGAGADS